MSGKVSPSFDTDTRYAEAILRCPRCDGRYLHRGDVIVGSDVNGIKIRFECEYCAPTRIGFELVIRQHEGHEFVYWRELNDTEGDEDGK